MIKKIEQIGTKIRLERKKHGLTLEQLAKKLKISPITLQRIETGKTSPSVVLLSEIAYQVNKPVYSFFEDKGKPFMHIKRRNQRSISSPMLTVKLIGPQNMVSDNIVVTYGELKKGKTIDPHTNRGTEFTYIIEGKCEFNLDRKSYLLETGDSFSFDGKSEHSLLALEKSKFFGIYIKEKE